MRFQPIAALRISALIALAAGVAGAQATPVTAGAPSAAALTIDEAVALARRNNPAHQAIMNNRTEANARVRSAYGALLPSLSTSFSGQWQEGGNQVFGGAQLGASSDVLQSFYDVSLNYSVNAATFLTPRLQRAGRDAVEADIVGSEEALRGRVVQQYLTVLQAQARAVLQDTLVASARAQVELARARAAVGAGTQLDVRRAEVTLGQAQVQSLQQRNTVDIEKLRLFQEMGVDAERARDVQLTSAFVAQPVPYTEDQVIDLARRQNPTVQALRSRERVTDVSVKTAKAQYTPTFSVSSGIGGYSYQYANDDFVVQQAQQQALSSATQCASLDSVRRGAGLTGLTCGSGILSPAQLSAARTANGYDLVQSPKSIRATISLPIFDGFSREQRVQEAEVARADARYSVRAQELALAANVSGAFRTLTTAQRTVELQETNSVAAREALALAEERYRVGASTFVDVAQARADYERAETDRINAVYDYHKAFAALESAVGRPLRSPQR